MKLHRFYVGDRELDANFWLDDEKLFHQFVRVLRFQPGREIVLFNEIKETRLYRIIKIGNNAVHLELITEMEPQTPQKDIYLCFSLLKKDKNDWVLQKATELGASHFVPIIAGRTEKTGFDVDRAKKIVVEAAEQCGRSDVPRVREPISLESLINELNGKVKILVSEQGEGVIPESSEEVALLVGPEGGWTEDEIELFSKSGAEHISLGKFTLRAETAAITAIALLA